MPLRVLARVEDWIWQKLNEAILIRDHYVISFIGYSSYNLKMDTSYFRDRFDRVTNRKHKIQERMAKLLNFEVPEPEINEELEDLL